jgi:hypothetical protein
MRVQMGKSSGQVPTDLFTGYLYWIYLLSIVHYLLLVTRTTYTTGVWEEGGRYPFDSVIYDTWSLGIKLYGQPKTLFGL